MGSFIGHIDEASVFLILWIWWMYNSFTKYIKASTGNRKYETEMSYFSTMCGKTLPLEQILKIGFPIVAIIGECIDSGFQFWGKNGKVAGVDYLMHISIYLLFVVHGIVDLLLKKGCKIVPPTMDYITAAIAFIWYGMGMYFHAHMERKTGFENMIHLLATYPLFTISALLLLLSRKTNSFVLDFLRCYTVGLLGTWITHSSFMLFKPGIPGREKNPAWDRYNYSNNHFIPVAFGFHMGFDMVVMLFFYAICYWRVSFSIELNPPSFKPQREDPESTAVLLNGEIGN